MAESIVAVRYLNIDYFTDRYRHGEVGPRPVEADEEWLEPTWRHPACDTIDFAVELQTESGRRFTVSWENPGNGEGLGLREIPALGNPFRENIDIAVWDVTQRSGWRDLVGRPVSEVVLHYEPWDDAGALWCNWITVEIGVQRVEFLLAEGQVDKPDAPEPSANNVAVVFRPSGLPAWLTTRAE